MIASLVAQMVKVSAYSARDPDSIPGLGRSPGEGKSTPVFLPGKFHGWRSLKGYSPWDRKEWVRLTDFTFTFNILDTNVAGDMSGSREMITDIKTLRL